MKRKIFLFIIRKLLKVPDGEMGPLWLSKLFYPFIWYVISYNKLNYDFTLDVYTIEGIKYTGEFFKAMNKCYNNGDGIHLYIKDKQVFSLKDVDDRMIN